MAFWRKKNDESRLVKSSEDYHEDLVFRLSAYTGLNCERRKMSASSYYKDRDAAAADETTCINMTHGVRGKNGDFDIVCHGRAVRNGENGFKALLEALCGRLAGNVAHPYLRMFPILNGCASVSELDLRLTANGI